MGARGNRSEFGGEPHRIPEQRLRGLVALADGRLHGRGRRRLEAKLAASPELRRALADQRRAAAALAAVDRRAPAALRRRLLDAGVPLEPRRR